MAKAAYIRCDSGADSAGVTALINLPALGAAEKWNLVPDTRRKLRKSDPRNVRDEGEASEATQGDQSPAIGARAVSGYRALQLGTPVPTLVGRAEWVWGTPERLTARQKLLAFPFMGAPSPTSRTGSSLDTRRH